MPDRFYGLDWRIALLEYFFRDDLAQDSVYAENTDENLEVQVCGEIAQSVFFLQLKGDQNGIQTRADGERKKREVQYVIHCPGSHHPFHIKIYKCNAFFKR